MVTLPHVPASYRHYVKCAEPRGSLATATSELKYYHVAPADHPVEDAVASEARAFLEGDSHAIGLDSDRGFVVLHRCGLDFYFLLVTVWRGANEGWEAVYYRDGSMDHFAIFEPAYPHLNAPLRPTFCVWELGVVAHEAQAWSRFLASPRLEVDESRWRNDVLRGEV